MGIVPAPKWPEVEVPSPQKIGPIESHFGRFPMLKIALHLFWSTDKVVEFITAKQKSV